MTGGKTERKIINKEKKREKAQKDTCTHTVAMMDPRVTEIRLQPKSANIILIP